MQIIFSEKAEKELDSMDQQMRELFLKHIEKVMTLPPRRHMKFGMPFNVDEVTKQARMIYQFEGDDLYILHCFKKHKDYERWYKSFK
ncbi:MAG: type II toxin-antitoxin system RelE/ParE family toxin [Candidatus Micrarchaeota archaeon]